MANLRQVFPLLRPLFLLQSLKLLTCIAVDDLQQCPGKSLLQASAHRSTERTVEIENLAHANDSSQELHGFRMALGEFCILCIALLVLLGVYWWGSHRFGYHTQNTVTRRPRSESAASTSQPGDASSEHVQERQKSSSASSSAEGEAEGEVLPDTLDKKSPISSEGEAETMFGEGELFPDTLDKKSPIPSQKKKEKKKEKQKKKGAHSPDKGKFDKSSSIAAFAFTEESDGEEWQVGTYAVKPEYDPEGVPHYIETHFSSWKLLFQISGALAQFWGALAFMYWSLLTHTEELMDCEAYPSDAPHFTFVTHACHYTLACLQGFPVLAANMILVLMVRTLMQTRIYYSLLGQGFLVVFQNIPVMQTMWPWLIGFSMLQGGLHFLLKAIFHPETMPIVMWMRLVRKFVLPGSIFFSMLFRYADVENTLVPLNHIAELEHTEDQDHSPWLADMKIMNERVLAFDVRHRDVYSDTLKDIGRLPGLNDLIQNVIQNYETARGVWHTRMHRSWGLFRSMWPAAILLDRRLDYSDKDTRSWMHVATILLGGCVITSLGSVYIFLACTSHDAWHLFAMNIKSLFTSKADYTATPITLGNSVTVLHAVAVIVLLVTTVHNMFYFCFSQDEVDKALNKVKSATEGHVKTVTDTVKASSDYIRPSGTASFSAY